MSPLLLLLLRPHGYSTVTVTVNECHLFLSIDAGFLSACQRAAKQVSLLHSYSDCVICVFVVFILRVFASRYAMRCDAIVYANALSTPPRACRRLRLRRLISERT